MSGRVAAVTGANRGIGYELAAQLAAAGDTVILTARDRSKAAAAAQTLAGSGVDGGVVAHRLDVTPRALRPSRTSSASVSAGSMSSSTTPRFTTTRSSPPLRPI
jgi:NAD(P)-dependent dehydrogenase (short-subunit alcohol dehydrogenase family)